MTGSIHNQYYLPDGSYGNIGSGNYTLASGKMNLLTGSFTVYSSGQNGDLYGDGESPITSTLPMSTPWTGTGVGTAIPASEVSENANHTITLPPSDIPASTSSSAFAATHSVTRTDGNAAKSPLGGLPAVLLLVALAMLLL